MSSLASFHICCRLSLLSIAFALPVALLSCSNSGAKTLHDDIDTVPVTEKEPKIISAPKNEASFNVDSAMAFLKVQTDFGPRVPGSAAHTAAGNYLVSTLRRFGATVTDRPTKTLNPETGKQVDVRNIFAQFHPDVADRMLVIAHYDTRPWADMEADASKHNRPIDGANDGASGVAVALELSRLASLMLPANKGLDILFVDMEDSGSYGNDDSWCLGSARWAEHDMPYTETYRPWFGVLLDMVGGKDAKFYREQFSDLYAAQYNDIVWETAAKAGHADRFVDRRGGAINDDHLSLLKAGIPTVDIIEMRMDGEGGFNPTWHTLDDNFDNIDPATVAAVGDVMTKLIFR